MFVFNVKVNSKSIVKISLIIVSIIIVIFFLISLYKVFSNSFKVKDNIPEPDIAYISADCYTNVLKNVYENLDIYVGQKVRVAGYVYRNLDFTDSQFVIARDMLISDSTKTFIVGFLCNCNNAKTFADGTWVEITGEITKGNYHGDIPIVRVNKIEKIEKPSDEYAYPPDATYIPTGILY